MIVKSGFSFIIVFWSVALAFSFPNGAYFKMISALFFLIGGFTAFFFRNPEREISQNPHIILSPGDGRVLSVDIENIEGFGRCRAVKIFLSIFNVHLQRSPITGTVESITKKGGAFKAAFRKDASELNAKNIIVIKGYGITVGVVQITGLIARRLECWVKESRLVAQGERIGFIRFGSQVDLLLPENAELLVKPGDKVKAGLSAIGRIE